MRLTRTWLLAALAAVLLVGLALTNSRSGGESTAAADRGPSSTTTTVLETDAGTRFSSLPTITYDELPIEALETLLLIDGGGPFPFDRDDTMFQNREGLLPERPLGHYREYTVITPGEDDRGARRIVAGADGERYFTADHYASFRELTEP